MNNPNLLRNQKIYPLFLSVSMLLSNINLKFYTSTAYHHEELKPLTRYNLNLVKERARLKSSISRPDCILFPELKNSFLRCSQFLFIPCWKSFPEPNRLSKLVYQS